MIVTPVPANWWHSRFPDLKLGDAILGWLLHCAYRLEWVGPQVTAQS
jgi:hypothetical protein